MFSASLSLIYSSFPFPITFSFSPSSHYVLFFLHWSYLFLYHTLPYLSNCVILFIYVSFFLFTTLFFYYLPFCSFRLRYKDIIITLPFRTVCSLSLSFFYLFSYLHFLIFIFFSFHIFHHFPMIAHDTVLFYGCFFFVFFCQYILLYSSSTIVISFPSLDCFSFFISPHLNLKFLCITIFHFSISTLLLFAFVFFIIKLFTFKTIFVLSSSLPLFPS